MKHRIARTTALVIGLLIVLVGGGCRGLIGIRGTIVGEPTILERQALGRRGQVGPGEVLLRLRPEGRESLPDRELRRLEERWRILSERLSKVENPGFTTRFWQAVVLHNRAIALANMEEKDRAVELLQHVADHCRAYSLETLRWHVLSALGRLRGGESGYATMRRAERVLFAAPILSQLEYRVEDREARGVLYGRLIDDALAKKELEVAFGFALRYRAVDLARVAGPGEVSFENESLAALVTNLEDARRRLADARSELFALGPEEAEEGGARAGMEARVEELQEVRARLHHRDEGGLIVPAEPDPYAIQEDIWTDTGLLVLSRLEPGRYAAFLLTREGLRSNRFDLTTDVISGASSPTGRPPDGAALEKLSRSVFGPFDAIPSQRVGRLYLICPDSLREVAWHEVPLEGRPLIEGMELSYLGGGRDLNVASRHRSYGRDSLLVVRPGDNGTNPVSEKLSARPGAQTLPAGRVDADSIRYADFLWFGAPLELNSLQPVASYVRLSPTLGRLTGLGPARISGYELRAGTVAFDRVGGTGHRRAASLRVIQRALAAAGAPSCVFAVKNTPQEVRLRFWTALFDGLTDRSAGRAFRDALLKLDPEHRGSFRLQGFLGMNEAEYGEYSRIGLNERFGEAGRLLESGQHARAAAAFLDVWEMVSALQQESDRQKLLMQSNCQRFLVRSWEGARNYERAARHQEVLIGLLKQRPQFPPRALGLEYQSLAKLRTNAEHFAGAVEAYRTSIQLLQQHGEPEQVAHVLGELGQSYDRAADYDAALQNFQNALRHYRELEKTSGAARQLRRMGALTLRRLRRAFRAQEYFQQAQKLYEEQNDVRGVIRTRIDIGLCRRHVGDFSGALELFQTAESEAEERVAEADAEKTAALRELHAEAIAEIANTRWLQGRYETAFRLIQRSNELARQVEDHFQLNANHQLLGLINWELNRYGKAHEALDTGLRHARLAGDRLEVAGAYNNRGIVYRRQEEYDEALQAFRRALEIDEELHSLWGQGYDHRNIGITLHRMGRTGEAAAHLEKAVHISRQINDAVNLARSLYYLGNLRREQGRNEEADRILRQALEKSRSTYLPEIQWRSLRALGLLHKATGETDAALERLQQAVEVVEELRGRLKVQEFRSGFLTNKMDLYEETVRLLLEMDRSDEAFRYAERSRARHFIDILAEQDFDLATERESTLYEQQRELARRIRALRENLAGESEQSPREELSRQLRQARESYRENLVQMQVENPDLASLVTVRVSDVADLHRALGADVSLVVYYLMRDRMAIWVLRNGRLQVRTVDIDRDELSARVRDYRVMIQRRELLESVRDAGRELHGLIWEPISELVAGSRAVGIVPHRVLHYLSFASLHGESDFLVSRLALFYLPGASLLPRLTEEPPPGGRRWKELNVLAVGNPQAEDPALRLPFTAREVESLRRTFVQVTSLEGAKATEGWVKRHISEFDVLHFAAHGYFNPVNPLFSALVLTPNGEEDGVLELHEVTGLEINAHLVSLSACQSGVGRIRAADELVSLSRAFLYAGTNSILSTLWRVDDVSTALLAKHFYRRYAGRIREEATGRQWAGRASSLRDAQIEVMTDGRHYHPVYWAPLTLTGDYR